MGIKYVDDFEFPSEAGFTGSAGKQQVRGYMRGGRVKDPVKHAAQKPRAEGPGAARGGHMKHGKHVGGPNPGKEYPPSQAHQKMPANVKARGGYAGGGKHEYARGGTVGVDTPMQPRKMTGGEKREQKHYAKKSAKKAHGGSMNLHDQMVEQGAKMGYKYGGQVKNTSSEFVQRHAKQDDMDYGTDPGVSRTQAEKEAGGRARTKPKLAGGGKVAAPHDLAAKPRRKASKSGMPKNVKAEGGLAKYAEGGKVRHPSTGILGGGAARKAAEGLRSREQRVRSTVDEALKQARKHGEGEQKVKDKPPTKAAAPKKDRIYREKGKGVPTFTDVPKYGKRVK